MLITISGLAGSGKDTAASLLQDILLLDHGTPSTIERYAAPLKTASGLLFGPGSEARDRKEKVVCVTHDDLMHAARQCLTELGIDVLEAKPTLYQAFQPYAVPGVDAYRLSPRQFQQVLGTEVVRAISESAFVDRLATKYHDSTGIVPDCRFQDELVGQEALFIYRAGLDAVSPHASEQMAQVLHALVVDFEKENGFLPITIRLHSTTFDVIDNTGALELTQQELAGFIGGALRRQRKRGAA